MVENRRPPPSQPSRGAVSGARIALFNIGAAFRNRCRRLQALVGHWLKDAVFQRAGASGGAACGQSPRPELPEDGLAAGEVAVGFDLDPLVNSQARLLSILFDHMPMGIAIFDRNLVLRRFNPTWAEFIGRYTPTPASRVAAGVNFYQLAPGSEPYTRHYFQQALTGETVQMDALAIDSAGTKVLALLVRGLNNPEIADRLMVSRSTVKFHVSSILAKLQVDSRIEAVALAFQRRLVP